MQKGCSIFQLRDSRMSNVSSILTTEHKDSTHRLWEDFEAAISLPQLSQQLFVTAIRVGATRLLTVFTRLCTPLILWSTSAKITFDVMSRRNDRTKRRLTYSEIWFVAVTRCVKLLSDMAHSKLLMALVLTMASIGPTRALDNEMTPDPGTRIPIGLVGTYALIVAGLLTSTTKSLLGTFMGISSVLWFIMRNDAAIGLRASWS
jgi:hypothetical protein